MFSWLKSFFGFSKKDSANKTSRKPNFFDNETVEFKEVSGPPISFTKCGHKGSSSFIVNIWGNTRKYALPQGCTKDIDGVATVEDICPKCWFEKVRSTTIRCCLCGYAILPGEGVALYCKDGKEINKKAATLVGDSAVGCLAFDCCPSGGFFAGHWTVEGFRSAFGGKTIEEKIIMGNSIIGDT